MSSTETPTHPKCLTDVFKRLRFSQKDKHTRNAEVHSVSPEAQGTAFQGIRSHKSEPDPELRGRSGRGPQRQPDFHRFSNDSKARVTFPDTAYVLPATRTPSCEHQPARLPGRVISLVFETMSFDLNLKPDDTLPLGREGPRLSRSRERGLAQRPWALGLPCGTA